VKQGQKTGRIKRTRSYVFTFNATILSESISIKFERIEAEKDVHARQCKQQTISVEEIKGLPKMSTSESQETLSTDHRPSEWFLPSDELPIETEGNNPFPALHTSATVITEGTIYNSHVYTK
jgi:hypothetical protein